MKPITTTETAIVIPFDTLIALYDNGCLDPALVGYCLPTAIVEKECPEVVRDLYELEKIGKIVGDRL